MSWGAPKHSSVRKRHSYPLKLSALIVILLLDRCKLCLPCHPPLIISLYLTTFCDPILYPSSSMYNTCFYHLNFLISLPYCFLSAISTVHYGGQGQHADSPYLSAWPGCLIPEFTLSLFPISVPFHCHVYIYMFTSILAPTYSYLLLLTPTV